MFYVCLIDTYIAHYLRDIDRVREEEAVRTESSRKDLA